MAVQTVASGYPLRENIGSLTLVIYSFTSVADADTFDCGMASNVVSFWAQTSGNPVTQTSAGNGVTYSATTGTGVFTFYPGENSLGILLFILARI